MRIDYLKINGFGKIENKEIEFNNGINLISGNNEAGKTTLLKCISAMFYGLSKNKNGNDIPDSERYKPWGNAEFSGKMKYTLDSGEKIEIFRDFSKKNPKIFNENSEDISKEFIIDKSKGNQFFYEQTKIDEEMLFSTGLVEQQKVVLDDREKTTLTQKIANILTSGDENISYKRAIEKLNKDLIEQIGTERTVGRPINIVREKLAIIKNKIEEIHNQESRQTQIIDDLKQTEQKISELTTQQHILDKVRKIKNKELIELEKIKVKEEIIQDYRDRIEDLKNNKQRNNTSFKSLIILMVLAIINILLFLLNKKIGIISLPSCALLYIVYMILIYKKDKASIGLVENEIKILDRNKKEKEDEISKDSVNIQKWAENEMLSLLKDIDDIRIKVDITTSADDIDNIISIIENDLSQLKIYENTLKIEQKAITSKSEEKIELEEEFERLKEEESSLLLEEKRIKTAKEILEIAYKKMKNEITPKLTKELSKSAAKISNNKYKNIRLNDEEGLLVELDNGEYVNANRLSAGTIDQLYLSLRLSAFKEITNESIPIILDESFAYYDSERLKNMLKFLNESFKENQIIIFTCTDREKEILEESQIKYNYIRL